MIHELVSRANFDAFPVSRRARSHRFLSVVIEDNHPVAGFRLRSHRGNKPARSGLTYGAVTLGQSSTASIRTAAEFSWLA